MPVLHRPCLRVAMPLLFLLAVVASSRTATGQPADAGDSRQAAVAQALDVLASDAPQQDKLNACRRLAALGGPESVPALAALLSDSNLSHAARIGLEAIPDAAAGEALRAALEHLQGGLLIGTINSLGARRETRAIPDLGRYLTEKNPQVVAAAAEALGRMATAESLALLELAWPQADDATRPALANACLRGAAALRSAGRGDEAARLCQLLLAESRLTGLLRPAAARQDMLARPADAGPLLQELLASDDDEALHMALLVSREVDAPDVTRVLVASLPALSAPRRALVITALGDRGDATAREALVAAAADTDETVRGAALRALGRTGDASTLPLLLEAARDPADEIAAAAQEALAALPGAEVDQALAAALATVDGPLRGVLIDQVGRRRIVPASSTLVLLAAHEDEPTRLAALRALGQVAGAAELPVLTARLLEPAGAAEQAVVRESLRSACRRALDKDACAQQLVPLVPRADEGTTCFLIELLAVLGGPVALEAIVPSATDPRDALQDTATRVLGQWRTPDVAPKLIELARTARSEKYQVRALRACLRVARQMDVPDDQRLTMVRQALAAATRPEERTLAVQTLGRIPTRDAFLEAVDLLAREELCASACAAAVTIAEQLVARDGQDLAEPLQRVLAASRDPDLTRRAQAALDQATRDLPVRQ